MARAVYIFQCKVRLLLPLQIDRVVLGFLQLSLDTVLTYFLARPPVVGYLLHLSFIPQGERWDVSLQNTLWRAWGSTGLEEQRRDASGRSCAVGQSWEGAGGKCGHSVVLLACHTGWKQHFFLEHLWGDQWQKVVSFWQLNSLLLSIPLGKSFASACNLHGSILTSFNIPRNLSSSLH